MPRSGWAPRSPRCVGATGLDRRRRLPDPRAVRRRGLYRAGALHRRDRSRLSPAGKGLRPLTSIVHPAVAVLALGFRRDRRDASARWLRLPRARGGAPARARRASSPRRSFAGRAPEGHVTITAFIGGARNPDLANADLPTLTARVLDDLHLLLGAQGRAHLPRLSSLAESHPAVRPGLRPVQGYHGRDRAAEPGAGAGRHVP